MVATYADNKPSSRYRDLVDLVVLASQPGIGAGDLREAVRSELAHRSLTVPNAVTLPSDDWIAGYDQQRPETVQPQTAVAALGVADRLMCDCESL